MRQRYSARGPFLIFLARWRLDETAAVTSGIYITTALMIIGVLHLESTI